MKPSDAELLHVLIDNYEWALTKPVLFPPQSDALKQWECIAQLAKAELQRRAAPASVPAELRDYFAAAAMQSIASDEGYSNAKWPNNLAADAYKIADAMIAIREIKP